jgi:hypothetical protein
LQRHCELLIIISRRDRKRQLRHILIETTREGERPRSLAAEQAACPDFCRADHGRITDRAGDGVSHAPLLVEHLWLGNRVGYFCARCL